MRNKEGRVMKKQLEIRKCGIVMPISAIDGYTESHWSDVRNILTASIDAAGFEANLVSDADDVGIIHKRIIQNLYDNPVVVCDVSGRNPNVMFELGLRLAFDKATIIVKDDATPYSFDTSVIEHLEYPRDLRFSRIVDFKAKLTEKLNATYEMTQSDPKYSTFLKHFGEFKVAKLEQKEVSSQEYILEELKSMRKLIQHVVANERIPSRFAEDEYQIREEQGRMRQLTKGGAVIVPLHGFSEADQIAIQQKASEHPGILAFSVGSDKHGSKVLTAYLSKGADVSSVEKQLNSRQ